MAEIVQLARLVWSGTLFTGESWSCSVHLAGPIGPLVPATTFEPAIKAWMTRPTSHLSGAARLTEIKFNSIDPVTGKYALPTSNNATVFPDVAGTENSAPGQLSLVVSTRTVLARGRGHAGRFYPPSGNPDSGVSTAAGQVTVAVAGDCAASASTLLTAINVATADFRVVVFSKAGQSVEPVTAVRVGRVYDTMRSRRSSLDENYQSAVVTD